MKGQLKAKTCTQLDMTGEEAATDALNINAAESWLPVHRIKNWKGQQRYGKRNASIFRNQVERVSGLERVN